MPVAAFTRLQAAIPALVTTLLVLAELLPLGLPYFGTVAPGLGVLAIFYWSIWRPDLMPASFVFAIGLVHDLAAGIPLGLTALVYVATHWLCISQRQVLLRTSFPVGWAAFALVALGGSLLQWVLATIYHLRLIAPQPVLVQMVETVIVYPAVYWLLSRTETGLLRPVDP